MVISHNHHELASLLATRKNVDNDRFEVRLYAVSLASLFFYWVAEPGLYVLLVSHSTFAKAALLTRHPEVIGALFLLAGICSVPMVIWAMVRDKPTKYDRLPRAIAARGAILGAVCYGMLWYVTRGTDFDSVIRWLFLLRAAGSLWFGFLFGRSLNSQTIREKARELGVKLNTETQDDVDNKLP